MVALWDLPKTIKYKKGKVEQRLKGLETLRSKLAELMTDTPVLLPSRQLNDLLSADLNQLAVESEKNMKTSLTPYSVPTWLFISGIGGASARTSSETQNAVTS